MDVIIWIAIGLGLAVAELFTVTFVLAMLAIGAFAAAIATAVGADRPWQLVVFAAVSAIGVALLRPIIRKHRQRFFGGSPRKIGVEALVDAAGVTQEAVDAGRGQVHIGGELWSARTVAGEAPIGPGENIRVVAIDGATAIVRRDQ